MENTESVFQVTQQMSMVNSETFAVWLQTYLFDRQRIRWQFIWFFTHSLY